MGGVPPASTLNLATLSALLVRLTGWSTTSTGPIMSPQQRTDFVERQRTVVNADVVYLTLEVPRPGCRAANDNWAVFTIGGTFLCELARTPSK